jgi:hypothetical protein
MKNTFSVPIALFAFRARLPDYLPILLFTQYLHFQVYMFVLPMNFQVV